LTHISIQHIYPSDRACQETYKPDVPGMLTDLGYTVLAADNPMEAILLAHENAGKIRLLLSDVIMPDMNGRDLAAELLSFLPELKCLFMSGYSVNAISTKGVLDEGVNFIQKPFSMRNLAEKIRVVLEA
jgi:two-component system, cell cycle sensor histidine kinase and response regulator CckA